MSWAVEEMSSGTPIRTPASPLPPVPTGVIEDTELGYSEQLGGRIRDSDCKLKEEKLKLAMRRIFFPRRQEVDHFGVVLCLCRQHGLIAGILSFLSPIFPSLSIKLLFCFLLCLLWEHLLFVQLLMSGHCLTMSLMVKFHHEWLF